MKKHHYLLQGESLDALNKLIEYDRLIADFTMTDLRKKAAEAAGKTGPEEDPAVLSAKLSTQFSSAQVRAYKDKLGFITPAVQVHQYGEDNPVYRAYHAFPEIAMNPGTSKANFGIGDMFKDEAKKPKERIAVYSAHEDYTGNHFAPPGARKLTEEEFNAYEPMAREFEYYKTPNEGINMPGGFDPAQHQTVKSMPDSYCSSSHVFLITGKAREALLDYHKKKNAFVMPDQAFRLQTLPPLLAKVTKHTNIVRSLQVGDKLRPDAKERSIVFHISLPDWEKVKDDLATAFTLRELEKQPFGVYNAFMVPRLDTDVGTEIAIALAKAPRLPKNPVNFGFEERESDENSVKFNDTQSGFPYMQIERFDGGDLKLLAFRLPENIKDVSPVPGLLSALSLDDYKAIAGAEKEEQAKSLPTHVFRIEGEAYDSLKKFDDEWHSFSTRSAAFESRVTSILKSVSPEVEVDEFRLRSYDNGSPRRLSITMSNEAFEEVKEALADHFKIQNAGKDDGPFGNRCSFTLLPQTDSENGKIMADMIGNIPYEPKLGAFYSLLGFDTNQGFDQLKVEHLDGMDELAVVYHLPSYVGRENVTAPEGTVALTKEQYITIMADSWDIKLGSPPPPRPAHLVNLPLSDELKHAARVNESKKSKDKDGLPLHNKSDMSWFG